MYIKIGNRKERNMEILFLNPVFKEAIWGGKLLNKCHFVYAYYMTEVMGWEEPEYYQNDEEIASGYWNREKYALESDKERYIQNIIDNLTAAYKTLDIYKADPLNGQFISHDEEKEAEHIKMMEYFRDNLVLGPSPDREVNDKPSREQIKNLIKIVNNIKEAVAFASMSSPFGLDNYAKKQIQEIESIKFPLFFAWGHIIMEIADRLFHKNLVINGHTRALH